MLETLTAIRRAGADIIITYYARDAARILADRVVRTHRKRRQCKTGRSRKLFAARRRILPGGVDSPVRAFKAVGGTPLFIAARPRRASSKTSTATATSTT